MALPVNIDTLLHGNSVEWERLEFKKGWNEESIMHTICAFANDINNWNGGYIIIGVEESRGRPVLPPSGLNINQLDQIQKKLIELSKKIQTNYFPVIEPISFKDKHIVVLWCPGGDYRPYSAPENLGKKTLRVHYIRRGSKTIKANNEEERILLELTAKIPYDDRINHQANISDLSFPLIQAYLQKIGSKLFEEAHKIKFIELCKQMQIVKGPPEYIKPTNVGLLMFSENPQRFFPGAYIDIAIYKDNDGTEYTQKEFKGPLHKQLRSSLEFINTHVIKETVRKQSGKAEAKGTGIPTIRKVMKLNGSPPPVFKMDKNRMYFLSILEIHPEDQDNIKKHTILTFCKSPRSRKEILEDLLTLSNQTFNFKKNILPFIEKGLIEYTIPENINSKHQKYIITQKGEKWLKSFD